MDLQEILCIAITLYYYVLVVRIVLSWIPALPEPLLPAARVVRAATDPLLMPLRGMIPPAQIGAVALDLSALIVFFGVWIVRGLICGG